MIRIVRAATLIVAVVALAAGCSASGGAIFAVIEQEERTEASDLPDTVTVANVIELSDGVFIAASSLLYRGAPTSAITDDPDILSWGTYDGMQPAGTSCRAAILAPDGLFYAVFATDTDGGKLYRTDPAGFVSAAAPDWTRLDVLTDATPEGLLLVGGQVFVTTTQTTGYLPAYGLVQLDTTTLTANLLAQNLPSPVLDGAFDGADYWFAAGNRLLTGTLPGPLTAPAEPAVPATAIIGGVHYDASSGRLWLSTNGGQLMHREGATWASTEELLVPKSNDVQISFTDFLSLDGGVYVGTQGRGIYRLGDNGLDQTSVDTDATRLPDKTIHELYTGTVLHLVDVSDKVFALTAGAGLWHVPISIPTEGLPASGWRWE